MSEDASSFIRVLIGVLPVEIDENCSVAAADCYFSTVGMPASCQASRPPLRGQTCLNPACFSANARPALECSFGQVQ